MTQIMKNKILTILGAFGLLGSSAFAALPEGVTTAISEFQADGEALIAAAAPAVKALLVAMFTLLAFWFIYRQIRKIVK